MIISKEFYNRSALDVAQDLLGKVLVREVDGKILKGKIVETEAYIGAIDKACHAYNGRRTKRTEILYEDAGVSYIYFIYGLYHCFNVVTNKKDVAEAVLIRALEPINEFDYISKIRYDKKYDQLTKTQLKNLTNGPSKLCLAYLLNKDLNAVKLYEKGAVYITDGNSENFEIVESKRIGIDYAEEAKDFLWRFYIKDNKYVSKK
ncbi:MULTISPECIES: DNA-3-methyladenine glycosylase [unclassified Clostridium]|uniref:DNA-3-methyladenine glycosylase n=1 Tax=unclassified Clostridium TaxID=2614128 RepID=UPI001897BA11|nr:MULTISPECIES: DNA-3-methyladenine glycosylase [unclassified Clostridium]MBP3916726.1 DNA-3-methyladenine glycosylase [Clostridium sp.]MEE0931840.1 DNA-3-methyladenine glycosylase [Clostridium sp.]